MGAQKAELPIACSRFPDLGKARVVGFPPSLKFHYDSLVLCMTGLVILIMGSYHPKQWPLLHFV